MDNTTLMKIEDLSIYYKTRIGWVNAIDKVSLNIRRGEVLGLVGESGCGKSTLGKALLRLTPVTARVSGHIWFDDNDLMAMTNREMRHIRGQKISMIFQDPMTSLNPVQNMAAHYIETILTHQPDTKAKQARERAAELVDLLGISSNRLEDYPHQLSGGMRQRVMIGLALALNADLIIADEATTSLDVIVEAQFLDRLRELRDTLDLTILMITHNIGVVAEIADRVAVMYAGHLAELGDVHTIFKEPLHPYTQGLMKAVPNINLTDDELFKMEGSPPDLINPPKGCRFHPRCPEAMPICSELRPGFEEIKPDHQVACWLHLPVPSEYQLDSEEPSK